MTAATRQARIEAGLLSPDDVTLQGLDIKEDLFLGGEEYEDLDDLLDEEEDDSEEEESEEDGDYQEGDSEGDSGEEN